MKKFLVMLAFIAGTVYLQWQGFRLDDKQAQGVHAISILQQENEQQMANNERMKVRLDDLRDNPDEIFEELAREKLFMIKPGEIYVLPQTEAN